MRHQSRWVALAPAALLALGLTAQARAQQLREGGAVVGLRPRRGGGGRHQSFTITITAEMSTQMTIAICTAIQKRGMGWRSIAAPG